MTDLMLRDPFAALDDPFTSMRRALDRLGAVNFRRMPELWAEEGHLALDVREEDGTYLIEASVPGFKKDEIDVEVAEGALTIRAQREHEEVHKEAHYHYRERYRGSVDRRVSLPGIAADAAVEATLKDGVLSLRIPVAEKSKTRHVEISEG